MRRADRLFQIIQILRRSPRPITAAAMARELEVCPRTIYRDMADLIGRRVPIGGEAGFGYVLEPGFDLPPLSLTVDEMEVALLGAQWVAGRGDPLLARAARDLAAKLAAVAPTYLHTAIAAPSIGTSETGRTPPDGLDLVRTREWIRTGRKLRIAYRDERGQASERVIWPVVVGVFETHRTLAAWCELRQAFRQFRTARILAADFLDEPHGESPVALRRRWLRQWDLR